MGARSAQSVLTVVAAQVSVLAVVVGESGVLAGLASHRQVVDAGRRQARAETQRVFEDALEAESQAECDASAERMARWLPGEAGRSPRKRELAATAKSLSGDCGLHRLHTEEVP